MARYLGFDYGLRRIGVAVGQNISKTASPIAVLKNHPQQLWHDVQRLVDRWGPRALIVGIPYNPGYLDQRIVTAAQDFSVTLGEKTQLPIHTVDERLTSHAAEVHIQGRGKHGLGIDAFAAAIILEQWLSDQFKELS